MRGGGGGGDSSPPKGGGGPRKGALVTGQSQEASPTPLMMTHQLRRKAARTILFSRKISPHDTHLKMISASWGVILSHICCGTSGPPPPPTPTSPVSPSGIPVTGAQKGGGVSGKGAQTSPPPPPPPAQANFPPALLTLDLGGIRQGSCRADLSGDLAEQSQSNDVYQTGHAVFSGFQSGGRLLAEVCGMPLPLPSMALCWESGCVLQSFSWCTPSPTAGRGGGGVGPGPFWVGLVGPIFKITFVCRGKVLKILQCLQPPPPPWWVRKTRVCCAGGGVAPPPKVTQRRQ